MYGGGIGALGFRRKKAGSGAIVVPPPEAPNITSGLKFTPAENVPVSTTIGIVTLVSGAANDFAIVSGNTGNVFAINNVGVLTNVSTLDYESITGYSLEVKASGTGGTNNKSVLVCVTDVFDSFPANSILVESSTSWLLTQGGSVIKTGNPAVNVITPGQQAQATEHDRNGTTILNVAYTGSPATSATIASGNTGSVFSVSATNGTVVLYNVSATDFETTPVYALGLKLENAGGYSAIVTASISIANITEPTINAAQAFTASNSDPFGTVYVTVAYSGATPHNFTIGGAGLAITSTGIISKTSASITAGNYGVQALMNGYTSPSVDVAVSVSSAPANTFSSETGDNIVLGITAWASTTALGSSTTYGSKTGWFRTNASKLYWTASGGTTGSTAPTHTSGTASDGSITWEYICAVDYTSLALWEASIPDPMVANRVGIIWAHAEQTSGSNPIFTINSRDVGSYTITLKAKDELAWYSHASPVGAYDATKGIAFRNTDTSYGRGFRVDCDNVRITGLQIQAATNGADRCAITEEFVGVGYANIYDRVVVASGGEVLFTRGLVRNSYIIKDSTNTANYPLTLYNGGIAANCIIARPSNRTAAGAAINGRYSGGTLINCGVFGFTVAPGGTVAATYTATDNATAIPAGTGNVTTTFNTTQFVQPSAASALDLRIPSGSALKNAGTTDTTNVPSGKDAFGTTRPLGAAWDIGPHEVG